MFFGGSKQRRFVLTRPPILPSRTNAATTYVCPKCDMLLADGLIYEACPACNLPVDWVNLRFPVWCCATCDLMINRNIPETFAYCERCKRRMTRIDQVCFPRVKAKAKKQETRFHKFASWLVLGLTKVVIKAFLLVFFTGPLLALALDPAGRFLLIGVYAPFVLMPIFVHAVLLGWALPAFRGLIAVVKDRRTRVIHGLEHATAKILTKEGFRIVSGQTLKGVFSLTLDTRIEERGVPSAIRRAFEEATKRLLQGEHRLAFHARCGTSALLVLTITSLLGLIGALIGLFLRLSANDLLWILLGFFLIITFGAPLLGILVQRFFTVSTRFQSAHLTKLVHRQNVDETAIFDVLVDVSLTVPEHATKVKPLIDMLVDACLNAAKDTKNVRPLVENKSEEKKLEVVTKSVPDSQPTVFRGPLGRVRNELYVLLKMLAEKDFVKVCSHIRKTHENYWTPEKLQEAMNAYFLEHHSIDMGPNARLSENTLIYERNPRLFYVSQRILDPEGEGNWFIDCIIDLSVPRDKSSPLVELIRIQNYGFR